MSGGFLARAKRLPAALSRRIPALKRLRADVRAARRRSAYRALRRSLPVEEQTILFEAYAGTGYSCSPKALYRAIIDDPAFDGFTLIWALKQPERYASVSELARADIVTWGSPEYLAAYARAKYWLCNCAVPAQVWPAPDQVHLQTWHGTPFKRFGCDITIPSASTKRARRKRIRRWQSSAAKFTYLLTQSPFATGKLVSALGVDARAVGRVILDEGYPRNDSLVDPSPAEMERIRRELDLPAGKHVILYAPTWRDEQRAAGVGYTTELADDLDRLRRDLGEDHVLLFRSHFMVADLIDLGRFDGFVRDVSRHDDINDLYLAADVLVTDYSSAFFDYANLGRPVVFYMYDLEQYAGARGGFYLGLEELPGPIVRDRDALGAAIRAAEVPDPDREERLRAFRERFAPKDDGHASERVLARVFGVRTSGV